ncbi:hypothetical protein VmeM32_00124 [Vibrio phage vB_VmeM-32]|nr:hypothetical protein VmeM32_00124 [Vibrio phage vB_VmeM-32]
MLLKFKDFITEAKLPDDELGCYVAVNYKNQTNRIFKQISELLLSKSKHHDDYHTTLIYSKCSGSFAQLQNVKLCPQLTLRNVTLKTKHLGKNNECLVLLIEHEWFKNRHSQLMKEHNFSYDFDEYTAHVTLTYIDKDNVPDDMTFVVDLYLDDEYKQPVNEDYA